MYNKCTIIQSSDAHYLLDIAENGRALPNSNHELIHLVHQLNNNN